MVGLLFPDTRNRGEHGCVATQDCLLNFFRFCTRENGECAFWPNSRNRNKKFEEFEIFLTLKTIERLRVLGEVMVTKKNQFFTCFCGKQRVGGHKNFIADATRLNNEPVFSPIDNRPVDITDHLRSVAKRAAPTTPAHSPNFPTCTGVCKPTV